MVDESPGGAERRALRRSFRFLLRPTPRQDVLMVECLEDHRTLYNAAIEERRDAWRKQRLSVGFCDQSRQLPDIRAADPGLTQWAASSLQGTLRRADRSFQAFFRRLRAGERPGYPRFKGEGWFDTIVWPQVGNGCAWLPEAERVRLKAIGDVRVHPHRPVRGRVKTISIKREGQRWHLLLSCDDVPAQPLPATGAAVGVDMGVASFLTTSIGEHIDNPRWLHVAADRMTTAQQALSRCSRRSNRRRKARARMAALHAKVRRQRQDFHRKLALDLVRRHDLIVHEALAAENMTRSAKGTVEEPGRNVAQKAGLNRSILDAGWGSFLRCLTAAAESAQRQVVAVNPRHTSQTCPWCGCVDARNRVSQADFVCVECGHAAHADEVAALVILRLGLSLREAA